LVGGADSPDLVARPKGGVILTGGKKKSKMGKKMERNSLRLQDAGFPAAVMRHP
jgi:hypothetical protein